MPFDYDAFLSYNRADWSVVEPIALSLTRQMHLRVFVDKWCLIPGEPWQDEIEQALDRSSAYVIFIGASGPSPWGHVEMRAAVELRVNHGMLRVIPVLLPGVGAATLSSLPLFLKAFTWVDFRKGQHDETAFNALKRGIEGYPPGMPEEGDAVIERNGSPRLGTTLIHSLLPAVDFQDRPESSSLSSVWGDGTRSCVLALIGIGGSGKTALVCRFLQRLPLSGFDHKNVPKDMSLPAPDGVFVWSFYDDPDIEHFVRCLFEFLAGRQVDDRPARETIYEILRLIGRSSFRRVLLVFDGIEVVQESRDSEGDFGVVRDSSLRHLIRLLAQGGLGVWVILTSRFPLPDLAAFYGLGYIVVDTDNLDEHSARALLRSRGVRGSDSDLAALVKTFGNHALTLDHLGTLLHDFLGGNASRASQLPPMGSAHGTAQAEYQARRLARIFRFYQRKLPALELDLLSALCVFRLPVALPVFISILSKGLDKPQRKGPELDDLTVIAALKSLQSRRLLSLRPQGARLMCVVHPSVRDYFYRTMRNVNQSMHASIRDHFVSLIERPGRRGPLQAEDLDLLEELIHHSIQSGDVEEAADYYDRVVYGYRNLGWRLADYQRGLRITAQLMESRNFALCGPSGTAPSFEHALFSFDVGHLTKAESQLRDVHAWLNRELRPLVSEGLPQREHHSKVNLKRIFGRLESGRLMCKGAVLQALSDILLAQGKLKEAEDTIQLVIDELDAVDSSEMPYVYWRESSGWNPLGRRAAARYLMGQVSDALTDFGDAHRYCDSWFRRSNLSPIDAREASTHFVEAGYVNILHSNLMLRLGRVKTARRILRELWHRDNLESFPLLAAQSRLVMAESDLLDGKKGHARQSVDSALAWAIQSGHQQTYVMSNVMKFRVCASAVSPLSQEASSALQSAQEVSRNCGFRTCLVDALVLAGYDAIGRGEASQARKLAEEAYFLSVEASCSYKWGAGSAAHLLSQLALEMSLDEARKWAKIAVEIRKEIRDARLHNSVQLLRRVSTT